MERLVDIVCGMEVTPVEDTLRSEDQAHAFYFCSSECKRKFDAHPESYIPNRSQASAQA